MRGWFCEGLVFEGLFSEESFVKGLMLMRWFCE